MAIKPVKYIPGEEKKKQPTAVDLVTLDIKEAISKNVKKFQFTGSNYNYKYLPQTVRDTSRTITRQIVLDRITPIYETLYTSRNTPDKVKTEFRLAFFENDIKNLMKTTPYIDITTVKRTDTEYDVYAEIIPENLDTICKRIENIMRDNLAKLISRYDTMKPNDKKS